MCFKIAFLLEAPSWDLDNELHIVFQVCVLSDKAYAPYCLLYDTTRPLFTQPINAGRPGICKPQCTLDGLSIVPLNCRVHRWCWSKTHVCTLQFTRCWRCSCTGCDKKSRTHLYLGNRLQGLGRCAFLASDRRLPPAGFTTCKPL